MEIIIYALFFAMLNWNYFLYIFSLCVVIRNLRFFGPAFDKFLLVYQNVVAIVFCPAAVLGAHIKNSFFDHLISQKPFVRPMKNPRRIFIDVGRNFYLIRFGIVPIDIANVRIWILIIL